MRIYSATLFRNNASEKAIYPHYRCDRCLATLAYRPDNMRPQCAICEIPANMRFRGFSTATQIDPDVWETNEVADLFATSYFGPQFK